MVTFMVTHFQWAVNMHIWVKDKNYLAAIATVKQVSEYSLMQWQFLLQYWNSQDYFFREK